MATGSVGRRRFKAARGDWLEVEVVSNVEPVLGLSAQGLERGEAEAILLAEEIGQRIVFMDDERGVQLARARGLEVVRTPAIYMAAKRRGWIDRVRPKLDALRDNGVSAEGPALQNDP